VVEGNSQYPHLPSLTVRVVDARVQVAGIYLGGDSGHAAQRTRHAGADHVGGEQRAGEREDAGEDKRARHTSLGVSDCEQRLAYTHGHQWPARDTHRALENAQITHVGEAQRRVSVVLVELL